MDARCARPPFEHVLTTRILTAERFSPWGYSRDERSLSPSALALA
jgi:hypothetical protein